MFNTYLHFASVPGVRAVLTGLDIARKAIAVAVPTAIIGATVGAASALDNGQPTLPVSDMPMEVLPAGPYEYQSQGVEGEPSMITQNSAQWPDPVADIV